MAEVQLEEALAQARSQMASLQPETLEPVAQDLALQLLAPVPEALLPLAYFQVSQSVRQLPALVLVDHRHQQRHLLPPRHCCRQARH